MLMQCFIQVKVNFEKKIKFFPLRISVSCTTIAKNTIMLPHLFHSSLHYLSTARLREVKNKGKCQTKGGCGRLQEVPNTVIKLLVFWKAGR